MGRLGILIVFLSFPALANDPFECVDPEIADAFLGQSTFSTTLPPDFPSLDLPRDFVLIGSRISGSQMTAVFKSNRNSADPMASTLDALKQAGWKLVDQLSGVPRGFQTSAMPNVHFLCRDSAPGTMNVSTIHASGLPMVALSMSTQQSEQTCADLTRRLSQSPFITLQYMPRLTLPSGTKATDLGTGGGGGEMSSRIVASTDRSREELIAYLGDQIRSQGWRADSDWGGSLTAGTVWSLSTRKDGDLVGILRVTQASDQVFNIQFSVSAVTSDQGVVSTSSR